MQPLISELVMAWALSLPIDGDIKCQWFGVKTYTTWNRYGYGARVSHWMNNEVHVALGRNGFIFGQFRIW